MNEDILAFIWRFQYFETSELSTAEGSHISVIKTGLRNANAGPDFYDARIEIDGIEWAGCVEIHVKSSDWFAHRHENDRTYESVVLHVVWENDRPVYRNDGSLVPTLILKGLVRRSIIERFNQLQNGDQEIPCGDSLADVPDLQKFSMLDRVLLERLDKKAGLVLSLLQNNQGDWEETSYQWLCQHFGFKLNDPSFLRLSQALPLKYIQRHKNSRFQIEALLFGQAGLIPASSEIETLDKASPEAKYISALQKEYGFLASKYGLRNSAMQAYEWKFLRLRPAGFPTVRMAQLASFLCNNNGIFSALTLPETLTQLQEMFTLSQSDYWSTHFRFGIASKIKVPVMGRNAAHLLVINAVVPLLVAYSQQRQMPDFLEKAITLLGEVPNEDNRITRQWSALGMRVKTAADSQSLIEWYNHYCSEKRCLECIVGAALLRSV